MNFRNVQTTKVVFAIGMQVPFLGAAWRRIEFFAQYFSLKNFKVCVVSPRTIHLLCGVKYEYLKETYPFKLFIIPLKLHICRRPVPKSLLEIFNSLLLGLAILLIKPKIVILSIPPFHHLLGIYMFSRLSRAKLIVDMRDPIEISYIKYYKRSRSIIRNLVRVVRAIEYAILYRANAIACVCETMARDLSRVFQPLTTRIHLIPNGADLTKFKPLEKAEIRKQEDFRLFFMGRTIEGYNISTVLKALLLLKKENLSVKLYIAGILDPVVCAEAKKLGVLDDIEYLGLLSTGELAKTISEMDLGIVSYYNDKNYRYSLPAKFYEYIACGLPVLVSAPPYFETARMIQSHGVGVLCPVEDVRCIATAIKQLYEDKSKLVTLKERCRSFRHNVDRTVSAEKLLNIIKALLGAK